MLRLLMPWLYPSQQFGEFCLKHTEFVLPWITQHPEIKGTFLLVIPSCGAEFLQALNFGFDIVGLYINVHALFRDLFVIGCLEADSYVSVGEPKVPVNVVA
jgi:hypothetical protein